MKQTKSLVLFFLAVYASFLMSVSVCAQEASDDADLEEDSGTITIEKKSDEQEESATQILHNLENLVKDNDQSEEIKNQYGDVVSKARGFIGQVSSIKEDSFKVTRPDGEELLIVPDKSTMIVKNGEATPGNEVTLTEWFEVDDWLVLIGIQNGDSFGPRRILISSESLLPSENFVNRGIIKQANRTKVDVQIVGETDAVETFNYAKSTDLVNKDNETITYEDLKPGMQVLIIGEQKGTAKTLQTLRLI